MQPLLGHLGSCLSRVRHGLQTTKCIQEKGSGQTNHRQISGRLTRLGSTSRFSQNSITAWVMTGSAGTRSYSDHCGAAVIEFEGCREQRWNGSRPSLSLSPLASRRGRTEDHARTRMVLASVARRCANASFARTRHRK